MTGTTLRRPQVGRLLLSGAALVVIGLLVIATSWPVEPPIDRSWVSEIGDVRWFPPWGLPTMTWFGFAAVAVGVCLLVGGLVQDLATGPRFVIGHVVGGVAGVVAGLLLIAGRSSGTGVVLPGQDRGAVDRSTARTFAQWSTDARDLVLGLGIGGVGVTLLVVALIAVGRSGRPALRRAWPVGAALVVVGLTLVVTNRPSDVVEPEIFDYLSDDVDFEGSERQEFVVRGLVPDGWTAMPEERPDQWVLHAGLDLGAGQWVGVVLAAFGAALVVVGLAEVTAARRRAAATPREG